MKRRKSSGWWSLYIIAPAALGLLILANRMQWLGEAGDTLVMLGTVLLACGLAWLWSEKHADLLGSQGADAQAEAQALSERGIPPGSLAPSISARQAHYRQVMAASRVPVSRYDGPADSQREMRSR
jgi:hypothetical protein